MTKKLSLCLAHMLLDAATLTGKFVFLFAIYDTWFEAYSGLILTFIVA